ncbi:hypothetical protein QCN29_15125 [Streptomyces sp. HNM0663]|uniref:Uncharacterized protein n=1 Tax=Streptomyces chengmaiensis TaxID=3040919 RepID=A0ABT6HP54_9ACTN|nr:hypothetical protein [Streptomyces chengmaiensis]MDH2390100.1 hypothetical protein [Streptomyces chengmaiensis]
MTVTQELEKTTQPVRGTKKKPPGVTQSSGSGRRGMFVRLNPDDKQRAEYWADKRGFSSVNEYVAEALVEKIRRENLDYDLPTLEIARLNELVDQVAALAKNSANLERVVTTGFGSLIGLTRGDNYLLDDEDGELG